MKSFLINKYILLFFLINIIALGNAQNNIRDLIKGDRRRADELYNKQAYSEASDLYRKIASKDSSDVKLLINLAESLNFLQNTKESEYWFNKAFQKNETITAEHKLHYADVLLSNGKKEEAYKWYKLYNQEKNSDQLGINKMKAIDSYQNFYKDSLLYSVSPLNINSSKSDFCPAFFEKGIVFLSGREKPELIKRVNAYDDEGFMELYYSEFLSDSNFVTPQQFNLLNYRHHEGPVDFFDNNTKVIFSSNVKDKSSGISRLALYYSQRKKDSDEWSVPVMLSFNNLKYSSSHPCFDENTNTLYFVSDMPGGFGETDIYKTSFNNNEWSVPVNLGKGINSSGKELFPYISQDTCLYFTSNGHPGMGGLDLFMYDLKDSLSEISNLGYPINSSKDDFAMIVKKNGKVGFFSSNRNSESGDDIYIVRIHRVLFDGIVLDKLKASPLSDVTIVVTEIESGKIESILKSNNVGKFHCYVKPGRHYKVDAVKKGFKVASEQVFSDSKENVVIRKKFIIDKIHKTYVNGDVKDDDERLSNCKIRLVDFNSDSVEVFYTDESGGFQCEINTDTTNIFYMEKDNRRGIYVWEPVKNKKKGSRVVFLHLKFNEIKEKRIEGILKNIDDSFAKTDTLYLINELNGEESIIFTDEEGKFYGDLWEHGKYKVFVKDNNVKILVAMIAPSQKKFFEIKKRIMVVEE